MRIRLWTVLALAVAWTPAWAGDDWRLEKERDGVQISTRAVEGWSIREIRGATRIPARLSAVVAVLCDIDATAQMNDMVSEARIARRDSDTQVLIYNAMKMPWPVSNRDIVNQRRISQDPDSLAVTIEDVADGDAVPARQGYVRMAKSRQRWLLTPLGGQVQVEMRALTDPNGPIPAMIVNAMAVNGPYKSLVRLRELSASAKYAAAQLAFIKEPAGAADGAAPR